MACVSLLGTQGTIGYALPEAGYAVGAVSPRAVGQPLWAVGQPPVVYAACWEIGNVPDEVGAVPGHPQGETCLIELGANIFTVAPL